MSRLCSTTALICVTWVSALLTPASAADLARYRSAWPDQFADNNRKFLCHYGYDVYNAYHYISHSSSNFQSQWQFAATPIIGHGNTVSEIVVAESPRHHGSFKFRVSLYNDASGKPGEEITGTDVAPSTRRCQLVTAAIQPTLLTQGQQYWVVETANQNSQLGSSGGEWLFDVEDHHRNSRAMKEGGFFCCCSLCDTGTNYGWSDLSSTTDRPYVKLK